MWRALAIILLTVIEPAIKLAIAPGPGNTIHLEVEKTGLWSGRKHDFTFGRYRGTVLYDRDNPAQSQVQLTVEAASIISHDAWVSESDRKKLIDYTLGPHVLDVKRYPEITFASSRIAPAGAAAYDVEGMLTIRGVPKPVIVHVTARPDFSFQGTAVLRMTAWGIKPPSAALGLIGTKDEMRFSFTLEAAARYS